ncbi:outer membrane beta-barrel protein [Bacteroides rodentium]
MKKIITGMALLLVTTLSAFSQTKNITVSGRVVEDTKEPAIQATVQLLSLPDSTQASGVATSNIGFFSLPPVKPGKYVLKVSYIGFKTLLQPMQLSKSEPKKNVGVLTLETDAVMLAEAVVTAEAAQVQVVEDTLVYNSSAYRTPEGAMLEELVKKLPGAEVDDDGNVKFNGKELKKIMVDGKEFFGGDVKTGLKNLPVDMIDKLKTYDKKSDLARITGIDDGEEETVLDLTVKKGMNQGVFGNFDLAGGTEDRYMGRGMVNYFRDNTQVSFIAGANNVNDQGFSGGGGGPRWRRSNGLNATKELGLNFATETDKLELGGSARYNYSDRDAASRGYSENFLPDGSSSFSNSNSRNRNKNRNFNADFRLEWKPDTLTNIIFRPNISYGKSDGNSVSQSGTFNADPLTRVDNPNDYLDLSRIDLNGDDPLKGIRVNTSNSSSVSDGNSLSANASLQLNRKLNAKGRNITFRGSFGYGDSESDSYNLTDTRYFLDAGKEDDRIRRYNTSPGTNYNYRAQLTYSEPIARATFLQFSYQFRYQYRENDRSVFDLSSFDWNLGAPLPEGYEAHKDKDQSKYAEYKTYTHEAMAGLRFIRPKYQLNVGMNFQPQNTKLTYKKGDTDTVTTRNVFNFAPNVDLRMRFSKQSQLRLMYRGNSSQPNMENLLPVTDDSNPLNIQVGNPGLKPAFTHNLRLFFNDYNMEHQRGIFTHANFSATQNAVSNSRVYNEQTGGWTNTSKNINGNWNAFGVFGINTALKNKKFTVGSFSNVRYNNNVGYQTTGKGAEAIEQKNTTTELSLNERLNGTYRNDWLEFGLNGTFNYTIERNKLNPDNNQKPYNFSYGANTTIRMPWNMTLSTNIANQSRRGYTDSSMNRNELIWNAQLSQTFLKGNATVSFEMYDILKKQSNISRSLTASGRSVYEYNGVNSYCMLHFIYRLNIFGSKAARDKMQGRRGFGGPGFGPGHGPGGFGGRRPF